MVPTTSWEAAQLYSSLQGETSCFLPSNCNFFSAFCYSSSLDAQ